MFQGKIQDGGLDVRCDARTEWTWPWMLPRVSAAEHIWLPRNEGVCTKALTIFPTNTHHTLGTFCVEMRRQALAFLQVPSFLVAVWVSGMFVISVVVLGCVFCDACWSVIPAAHDNKQFVLRACFVFISISTPNFTVAGHSNLDMIFLGVSWSIRTKWALQLFCPCLLRIIGSWYFLIPQPWAEIITGLLTVRNKTQPKAVSERERVSSGQQ
jgi:hypothetical protein